MRDIDIRKEFSVLQEDYGLDILYIRASRYIRCKCYDPLHKEGDPNCSICMGSGRATAVEQRNAVAIIPERLYNNAFVSTDLGLLEIKEMIYALPFDSDPSTADIIVKPYFNKNGVVTGIYEAYLITGVTPVTGDNGRIELYNVKCKEDFASTTTIKRVLNEMTYKDRLNLKRGRKYICPKL